jgi:hypothetical protein
MKNLREYKWQIIAICLIAFIVAGYFFRDAWVKKVIDESDKKAAELQVKIDDLEKEKLTILTEKNDIVTEREEYRKRYETAKSETKTVIKYKTIKEVEYVESGALKDMSGKWEDCDRHLKLCNDNFDNLDLNYNEYIKNSTEQANDLIKQRDNYKSARDTLAKNRNRIYSALSIKFLSFGLGYYMVDDTMQYYKDLGWDCHPNHPDNSYTKGLKFDHKFMIVEIELTLFQKDILRKELF